MDSEDINIIDTIDADQIEVGDQIIVDGEAIEVSYVGEDPEAPAEGIRVKGFSWDEGDLITHDLHYSERVDVWAL